MVHPIPSRRALSAARFALFFTMAAWLAYFVEQTRRYADQPFGLRSTIEAGVYLVLVTLLASSACAYLLARLGHLQRARDHRRVARATIDATFDRSNPTMTAIVPSYREERRVIRQTLLSAALQEYPSLRVTLLIDDPPAPSDAEHRRMLEGARALPEEIAEMLRPPRQRFERALAAYEASSRPDGPVPATVLAELAGHYEHAIAWLRDQAAAETVSDHVDAFLADEVLGGLASDLEAVARALREAAGAGAQISATRVRQLHQRLVWIFRAELTGFERKRFASLSHEPNKAMNLNSYIGLMGGRYRIVESPGGTILLPVAAGRADLEIPDPDYVLTLDADSVLLPEYCLRLVAQMEQPENARVAVIQTPYSAFRGAPTRIERIAGATTDLQHIVHQGLTRYGATFWVGANAVLRKSALDDVAVTEDHDGFPIRRYISDRTVIEDTESSLDLRLRGWQLLNHPERLSYSATPPDFGALCIQRQRWANGGLVILPRLASLVRRRRGEGRRAMAAEAFLRLNYLASIAWASIGLWLLLVYPFDQALLSSFAILTAIPYFWAISTDLRRCGYRRTDVVRLYGFNIMLLAVNTVGAIKSIGQAIGGQKVAFARTPKVRNRTVAPAGFVILPFAIVFWSAATLANDIADAHYLHAAFAGVNATLTFYVVLALMGVRNAVGDVVRDIRERLYRPVEESAPQTEAPDWVTVLYHGPIASGEAPTGAAVAEALATADRESTVATTLRPAEQMPLDGREHGPDSPAPGLSDADARSLAGALTESLQTMRPGDRLVMTMSGRGLEFALAGDRRQTRRAG